MRSGAPLAFDPELAELVLDALEGPFGDTCKVGMVPAKERKELARNLIGLALGDPDKMKGAWRAKACLIAAGWALPSAPSRQTIAWRR